MLLGVLKSNLPVHNKSKKQQLENFLVCPQRLESSSLQASLAPCTHEKVWLCVAGNLWGSDGPSTAYEFSGILLFGDQSL
jgi:hypothetical protein